MCYFFDKILNLLINVKEYIYKDYKNFEII